MKRIFVFLFLLPLMVFAQTETMTSHLIGPFPAYRGHASNIKIAFLQCLSQDAKDTRAGTGVVGKKYPLIIGHHGQGERTDLIQTISVMNTSELSELYVTSLPSLLRYTTSVLYNKQYAVPWTASTADSTSFCYLFPQVWGGYTYTYLSYSYYLLQYVKDSLSDIIDTNRIYLAGLSLGGGHIMLAMQDTAILEQVAAMAANCPGYINPSAVGHPPNWRAASRWGGGLLLTHSTNDSITDKHPTTREGSYYSDRARDSLLKWKGITTLIYRRWTTGGHGIWDRMYNPANANRTDFPMTNGQNGNWSFGMHNYFLLFSYKGRRKLTQYWNAY
jgi:hypothetical protein